MTLYELTEELLALQEMAEDPDVNEQALADTMEAVTGEIEDKAEGYAIVLKNLSAESDAIKAEIKRLQAKKTALENSSERIKRRLEESMKSCGKLKFKTKLFSFGIQKNPAALKVADGLNVSDVPMEYLTFPAPIINKDAVKKAIESGAEFSWAKLEQGESLRIR